ncbi:MAG: NAD(P)H-binding protein [Polyangiales bacterium]
MSATLVTGASGNVGQEVVRALLRRGARVVAADHAPERAAALFGEGVTATRLDFRDRATWAGALGDADRMFLMRPPAIADVERSLNPFVDFARERGVDHVVFLSVAGAEKNKVVPHRKVEDHLRARGDRFTNLRPGFFAQNLQSAYRDDIVDDDRIYVPAGRSPVNWIDARDIAEVAALVLCDPEAHRGRSYTLAGPGPVPWSVVTDALTAELGRPIRYEPASVLGYALHLARRGTPAGAVAVQTILHFLLRFGQGATVDPTLERLLGRPGRSVGEYIHDHASAWARRG